MDALKIPIRNMIEDPKLELGIVRATGIKVDTTPDGLRSIIEEMCKELLTSGQKLSPEQQSAVRSMLKIGGFSPSGRNRPASEFLLRELEETRGFKYINNIVDINNYLSMKTKLPMSIFDAGRLNGALVIRIGTPGESYVFNTEGHVIDLKRLIVCCEEQPDYTSIPVGSPVKDSMHTKVFPPCEHLIAVIYSTPAMYPTGTLSGICDEMGDLLRRYAGAGETRSEIR